MRDFLEALWAREAGGYGELRVIKQGVERPIVKQVFIDLDSVGDPYGEATGYANDYDRAGYDVYFGVLTRLHQSGKAADVPKWQRVLWADLDPYKGQGNEMLGALDLGVLLGFPIQPSVIVDSGHGFHAYWLLRDEAGRADASLAMKGIAKAIGGDHTHDPARVLRVPGTHNHKRGDHVPVRLLRLDTTRTYRFTDFSEYVDAATPRPVLRPGHNYERRDGLPAWLDELIAHGVERGQRSEQCFKVAVWLARFGYSDEEIRQVFASSPQGIGEKYAERGDRWMDVTLKAARAAA